MKMKKSRKPKCGHMETLKKTALLLYEDYNLSAEELKKCKQLIEELEERSQGSIRQ